MSRMIQPIRYNQPKPVAVEKPVPFLHEQARSEKYRYLLAHADDGVIWGVIENGKIALSSDAFPNISPKLRPETLWEARLFGSAGEWFLWRAEGGWKAREIRDGAGEEGEYYDESVILWGTDPDGDAKNGFHPLREADLGIRHSPPLPLNGRRSLKLVVRHYLDYDGEGAVYVKFSRLVDLQNGGEK